MTRASSILFLIALTVSLPARAEVPLKSKAQLQDGATHIVVGKVQTVYSVMAESDDWVDTKSVAEIAVQRVEKGDRIQLAIWFMVASGTKDGLARAIQTRIPEDIRGRRPASWSVPTSFGKTVPTT
jgi:hypothetical protein